MLELAILGLLEEQALHGYELRRRLGETLGLLVSVSFGSLYPALGRLEASGAVIALIPEAGGDMPGAVPGNSEPRAGSAAGAGSAVPGRDEAPVRIPMTGSLAGERAAFRTARGTIVKATGNRATGRVIAGHVSNARSTRQRRVYSITPAGTEMFNQLLAGEGDPGEAEDDRGFALRLAFARHLSPEARLRLLERRRAVLTQRRTRSSANRNAASLTDTWRCALAERGSEALDGDINWLDRLIEAERARSTPARADAPGPAGTDPVDLVDPALPVHTAAGVVPDPVEPTSRKVPSS